MTLKHVTNERVVYNWVDLLQVSLVQFNSRAVNKPLVLSLLTRTRRNVSSFESSTRWRWLGKCIPWLTDSGLRADPAAKHC